MNIKYNLTSNNILHVTFFINKYRILHQNKNYKILFKFNFLNSPKTLDFPK